MRNYAVAPGEYLAEWIEENPNVTQAQLAERVGVSRKLINEILNAKAPISSTVATRLERVTSIPAKAWLLYQAQYDADCARFADTDHLAQYAYLISDSLGTYLRKVSATTANKRNPGQLVADFLSFVNCGTIEAYEHRCKVEVESGYAIATLKESFKKDLDPAMLLAWIAQAERQDSDGHRFESNYSESQLLDTIPLLKERSLRPDKKMLSDMQALLAQAGVTMLHCAPPKNFPLHGVTYWVNDAPVVVFSVRRKKDGYITWAIFHELGHILNDERSDDVYGLAKTKKQLGIEEKAANEFAKKVLFGSGGLSPFHGLTRSGDIKRTANRVGVSPGVAVAEMHKRRMLSYNYGNDLLVDVTA